MFFSRVTQNLLSEVLRTVVLEVLPPPVPPPAPPPPAVAPPLPLCEETPTGPVSLRSMLTQPIREVCRYGGAGMTSKLGPPSSQRISTCLEIRVSNCGKVWSLALS